MINNDLPVLTKIRTSKITFERIPPLRNVKCTDEPNKLADKTTNVPDA